MSALLIKADSKSSKILRFIAKKLGGEVRVIRNEQYEDLAFGLMMDEVKTGEKVSKAEVLSKLREE